MEDKLIKIFQKAKYEPDYDLTRIVWSTIIIRDKRNSRFKLWIFSFVGFASLVEMVPTFKILFTDLTRSGFYEYFSLIFSDTGSIISYWKEFVFSLAESLPVFSIISALSLLFICFLSLRYLMKQIGKEQLILSLR
jgi:hypothetical protein